MSIDSIKITEEYFILKVLMKSYDEAVKKNEHWMAYRVSVDLFESAQKLSDLALDLAKKHGH